MSKIKQLIINEFVNESNALLINNESADIKTYLDKLSQTLKVKSNILESIKSSFDKLDINYSPKFNVLYDLLYKSTTLTLDEIYNLNKESYLKKLCKTFWISEAYVFRKVNFRNRDINDVIDDLVDEMKYSDVEEDDFNLKSEIEDISEICDKDYLYLIIGPSYENPGSVYGYIEPANREIVIN